MKTKVMFVCLGNICRSPMAEFMFIDLVKKKGLLDRFEIASAATSDEAEGCGVHRGTVKKLSQEGIAVRDRVAVRLKKSDYGKYDYFIGMDAGNVRAMKGLFCGDADNKVYRLLDFSDIPRDIADPWYTGDFEATYRDLDCGLKLFLDRII